MQSRLRRTAHIALWLLITRAKCLNFGLQVVNFPWHAMTRHQRGLCVLWHAMTRYDTQLIFENVLICLRSCVSERVKACQKSFTESVKECQRVSKESQRECQKSPKESVQRVPKRVSKESQRECQKSPKESVQRVPKRVSKESGCQRVSNECQAECQAECQTECQTECQRVSTDHAYMECQTRYLVSPHRFMRGKTAHFNQKLVFQLGAIEMGNWKGATTYWSTNSLFYVLLCSSCKGITFQFKPRSSKRSRMVDSTCGVVVSHQGSLSDMFS